MPKIAFYRNRCIGCSVCYEQQPELWRLSNKDGKATLIHSVQKKKVFLLDVPEDKIEQTKIIAEACPVKIIKIYE